MIPTSLLFSLDWKTHLTPLPCQLSIPNAKPPVTHLPIPLLDLLLQPHLGSLKYHRFVLITPQMDPLDLTPSHSKLCPTPVRTAFHNLRDVAAPTHTWSSHYDCAITPTHATLFGWSVSWWPGTWGFQLDLILADLHPSLTNLIMWLKLSMCCIIPTFLEDWIQRLVVHAYHHFTHPSLT